MPLTRSSSDEEEGSRSSSDEEEGSSSSYEELDSSDVLGTRAISKRSATDPTAGGPKKAKTSEGAVLPASWGPSTAQSRFGSEEESSSSDEDLGARAIVRRWYRSLDPAFIPSKAATPTERKEKESLPMRQSGDKVAEGAVSSSLPPPVPEGMVAEMALPAKKVLFPLDKEDEHEAWRVTLALIKNNLSAGLGMAEGALDSLDGKERLLARSGSKPEFLRREHGPHSVTAEERPVHQERAAELDSVRRELARAKAEAAELRAKAGKAEEEAAKMHEAARSAEAAAETARSEADRLRKEVEALKMERSNTNGAWEELGRKKAPVEKDVKDLKEESASCLQQQLRKVRKEHNQLRNVAAAACESVLGPGASTSTLAARLADIPGRAEAAVGDGLYFGALITLMVLMSQYDSIDLQDLCEGFDVDLPNEELNTIEAQVAPTAKVLAKMIPPTLVLRPHLRRGT